MDQTPPTEESAALTQGLEKKAEALPLCLTPMEKVSVFDFPETGVSRLTTASWAPILPTVAGGVHRFIGALLAAEAHGRAAKKRLRRVPIPQTETSRGETMSKAKFVSRVLAVIGFIALSATGAHAGGGQG